MHSLLKFINHLNTVHSTIKFTNDISTTEIAFLDLIRYIKANNLYTRLHTKTTDRHMYLSYYSEHSMSLKRSILYSQFLKTQKNTLWTPTFIGGRNTYVFFLYLEGITP